MIAFVRHAQTELNREGRLQGRLDTPLSELGRVQAAALAETFAAEPVKRIVTSPLRRALETAVAIAEPHGLPVETDERLVELDYGDWDGAAMSDVTPAQWSAWRTDPAFAPPGGEALLDVTARVASFMADRATPDLVVAVSHVSPIKAAVCCALGVDESVTWRMHLGVAAVSRVGFRDSGAPYLVSFNELSGPVTPV